MAGEPIPIGSWGRISVEDRSETKESGETKVRWTARCRVRDKDGVLRPVARSGSSARSAEQELLAHLRERVGANGGGADGITPKTPMPDLIDLWLEDAEVRGLSTSTMRIYRSSARLYLKPYTRNWTVGDATSGRVDRLIKDHIARGLDSKALRKHLNQIFDLAVRHDALPANPVDAAARVRRKKVRIRTVGDSAQVAEIRALIRRWETAKRPGPRPTADLFDFVMLLVVTGARPGELLAARWDDVNLLAKRPYLEVTGTIKQEKGLGIYRQDFPKSETSERRVELPPTVVALLLDRKVAQEDNTIGAVFPSRVGTWQSYSQMRRRWTSAVAGSKYDWVTFKTFRKTIATLLAEEYGVKVAQDQLGHASQATTETFYIATRSEAPQVAEAVERFLEDIEG